MSTHSQSHKNAQRRHGIKKREKILKMMTENKQKGIYLTPEPKDRNFGYPIDGPNAAGLVTAYNINTKLFGDPLEMEERVVDGLTFGGRNKSGKSTKRVRNKRKSRRHKKNKNRSNKMSSKNKNRMSRKNKKRMSRKKKQI
jgi:hypothetical protein